MSGQMVRMAAACLSGSGSAVLPVQQSFGRFADTFTASVSTRSTYRACISLPDLHCRALLNDLEVDTSHTIPPDTISVLVRPPIPTAVFPS